MKFKKFVQQHIELIVICFSAILGVLEVVVARYPASMMILMVVFLIVPVMYVFKSSGRNYGKTLIGGLIIAVVFCQKFLPPSFIQIHFFLFSFICSAKYSIP